MPFPGSGRSDSLEKYSATRRNPQIISFISFISLNYYYYYSYTYEMIMR